MSAVSRLMAAFLEVDCTARVLMRSAGSNRQKEQLRDAVDDLRHRVLDIVAHGAAEGEKPLDLDTFRAIVAHARELGIAWTDMAAAFNQVREERPS